MVSQPERSTSMTASMSSGSSRRSNSGTSGNVPVAGIEGVGEAAGVERLDHLGDAAGNGHGHLVPKTRADLVERDLVVARVLVAGDVGHLAAIGLRADQLHQIELAEVLRRVADVEDLAGDAVD